jgi:hypothetical protein
MKKKNRIMLPWWLEVLKQIATAAVKKSALAAELYVELAPTSLSESDNLAMVV